jgi:hypothetical protein
VVLDGVSDLVVVVGFDSPMESTGNLRAPRLVHIGFHLGQEPIKLGLFDQLDAGERGGGSEGGVEAEAEAKAVMVAWLMTKINLRRSRRARARRL